ncbi:GSK3-beta interaction protein-like [Rhodnius prolixus]|uniref:DUF727 domain-containing protein n=3 Tax=Rhodnius TaxID=13248 RepID=T1HCK0_RHOPR
MDDNSPEHDWRAEAAAVVQDVQELVKDISVSSDLQSSNKVIFLNLTTLENNSFTVELSTLGFRIVGSAHNSVNEITSYDQHYYDTPYALLSKVSQSFHERLSSCLAEKLLALGE